MQPNTSYPHPSLLLYIRSTCLFLLVLIGTVIITPLMLIASVCTQRLHFKLAEIWAGYVLLMAKWVTGIDYTVSGLEHLKKQKTAVVLCKHQSAWETIALIYLLPPQCILLKKSLLFIPFWGWAMRSLNPIAIDRNKPKQALSQLLSQGTERLQQGFWVVIYPEGTRTAPHEHRKFSASGSLLAKRSQQVIIPIAHNAGQCWPKNSFIKYPGHIQLKIGAPILTAGRKSKDITEQAETWIKNTTDTLYFSNTTDPSL